MKTNGLDTYLNDHLAGPAFALPAARDCLGQAKQEALRGYLSRFIQELLQEASILRRILTALDITPDYLKMAVAWAAEKGTRLKLTRVLRLNESLAELEQLELLRLGVQGKRGMWALLLELGNPDARLDSFDLKGLLSQADDQIAALEAFRLAAGRRLTTGAESWKGSTATR